MKDTAEAARFDADMMKQMTPEVLNEALRIIADRQGKRGRYPLNARGVPEYRSVVFNVDHLFLKRKDENIELQKMVMSTEEAYQAALSLFEYYGDKFDRATLGTLMEWRQSHLTEVLVYFVPENVRDRTGGEFLSIICGADLYDRILRDPEKGKGSQLMTRETIFEAVEKAMNVAAVKKMQTAPLISIALYPYEEPLEAMPAAEATAD